jgi:hypothetical protein
VYFLSLATSDDLIEFVVVFDSAIRWYVSMYALFHRQTDVGLQETEGGFRTQVYTATDPADVDYAAVRAELNRDVERLDFNRHFAFCRPHRTVSASSRIVVHTDAGFAVGKTCSN